MIAKRELVQAFVGPPQPANTINKQNCKKQELLLILQVIKFFLEAKTKKKIDIFQPLLESPIPQVENYKRR